MSDTATQVSHGSKLRRILDREEIVPFIGVYDVFSASIAATHYPCLFLSGFGFAASYYGLPDIGFIAWTDMAAYVQRIRTILPEHHLLVDMDDGYGDPSIACHAARVMEAAGASGIILEDQQRPRRCGHVGGKQILPLDEYLVKLERVLAGRRDNMVVVARTDAVELDDILTRVQAFEAAGADIVLVDGIRDWETVKEIRSVISCPMAFNQIAGGKSPAATLSDLQHAGIKAVIYSTPCLFSAQSAIDNALTGLKHADGKLPCIEDGHHGVQSCLTHLNANLAGEHTL